MNIVYELLAKSASMNRIEYGQEINVNIDLAIAHDASMPNIIDELKDLPPNQNINYGHKFYVTVDHFLPSPNIKSRENYQNIKMFCENNEIHIYSNGEGVLHQVIAEEFGDMLEDKIIVGVDGHMCTLAGLGALPFSITANEMKSVLITGKWKFVVPKVMKVKLTGEFNQDYQNRITGKDISLFILKKLGCTKLKGNAILLFGNVLKRLSESQKMTIGNMLGEVGVRTVYFLNDNIMHNYGYCLDVNEIVDFIALPDSLENIVSVQDIQEIYVTQVYIGGCTNGRLDDMEQISKILLGKKIHRNVTLIICPASRKIANDMDMLGYSKTIRNSGGIIINPGCGACSGIHQGVISKEDVIVTTTPRNTQGRMGDKRGRIYLASPKVAAFSALEGRIRV